MPVTEYLSVPDPTSINAQNKSYKILRLPMYVLPLKCCPQSPATDTVTPYTKSSNKSLTINKMRPILQAYKVPVPRTRPDMIAQLRVIAQDEALWLA
jgi:hypothetical protein